MTAIEFGERILCADGAIGKSEGQRVLRVFTRDPALRQSEGQVGTLPLPYEDMREGIGRRLELCPLNENALAATAQPPPGAQKRKAHLRFPDIDSPNALISSGLKPSSSDPNFAQQMAYAVCSWTLSRVERALGREPEFAFSGRLKIDVRAEEIENAYYDPQEQAIRFGYYYQRTNAPGRTQQGALVSTALSHDIIVHETAHALLDGMRSHLLIPTNLDVLAVHEGFADLLALFGHFAHRDQVAAVIARNPNDLDDGLMADLARQFGQTVSGDESALRRAVIDGENPDWLRKSRFSYTSATGPHERGSLLSSAVFEAFRVVYKRKTQRLRSLHSGSGRPSEALVSLLAEAASKLADQFMDIVIRAIDYLPPVDVEFGEYLRAMITADFELVPDDPWGYREALVYAFRRFDIPILDVIDLSEESLLWDTADDLDLPQEALAHLESLGIVVEKSGEIEFEPFPTGLPPQKWRQQQAERVKLFLEALLESTDPSVHLGKLGLALPLKEERSAIRIESVRALRRRGPNVGLSLGYVIELVQSRRVKDFGQFLGGCTLIVDERGKPGYVIRKSVDSSRRLEDQRAYMAGNGVHYAPLLEDPRAPKLRSQVLRNLHLRRPCAC